MDISLLIRQRLHELGLEQRDLAVAIQVTDSYVSQLLRGKKTPPAPGRTDIYDKIGEFLSLPAGELARVAEVQRQEDLKKRAAEPTDPRDDGLLAVPVSQGQVNVDVDWTTTPDVVAGRVVTGLAIALLLGLGVLEKRFARQGAH